MCRKSKLLLLLSVLFYLLCFSPLSFSCYAEVILTDEESAEIMNEIQESKKDLKNLHTQLDDAKNTYSEQKESYEKQLIEVKNDNEKLKGDNEKLKTAVTVTGTSASIFAILMVLFIFI